MKYRNKETKRHRKPGTETEAGTAAPGRDGQAPERWEMAVQNRSFFPDRVQFSHLFPGFPGISHLFPHRFFCVMNMKIRPTPLPPPTSVEGEMFAGRRYPGRRSRTRFALGYISVAPTWLQCAALRTGDRIYA